MKVGNRPINYITSAQMGEVETNSLSGERLIFENEHTGHCVSEVDGKLYMQSKGLSCPCCGRGPEHDLITNLLEAK
jgi:hypothetical protein